MPVSVNNLDFHSKSQVYERAKSFALFWFCLFVCTFLLQISQLILMKFCMVILAVVVFFLCFFFKLIPFFRTTSAQGIESYLNDLV